MVHARDKARVISCGMPAFDPECSAPRSGKSGPSLAPREPDFPQVRSPLRANAFARRIDLIAPFPRTFAREGYKPGNQDPADRAAIERIASRLRGAKPRCGPKAKPDDRRHYGGISFDFENPLIGARQLYEKLGQLPEGYSLDRIDPRSL